ncbi:MAG: hypothetical protein EOO41_05310 [Methanobacteriota archaeon]|nr:MAG: hypothetical protein EOO41_05310 [Euryarchaeota archaeon]
MLAGGDMSSASGGSSIVPPDRAAIARLMAQAALARQASNEEVATPNRMSGAMRAAGGARENKEADEPLPSVVHDGWMSASTAHRVATGAAATSAASPGFGVHSYAATHNAGAFAATSGAREHKEADESDAKEDAAGRAAGSLPSAQARSPLQTLSGGNTLGSSSIDSAGGTSGGDARLCPHCDAFISATNYSLHVIRCRVNPAFRKVRAPTHTTRATAPCVARVLVSTVCCTPRPAACQQ